MMASEEQAKYAGMAAAEAAANEKWKWAVNTCITYLAKKKRIFDSNEVNRLVESRGYSTQHPCAMGSLFHRAAKNGVIRAIEFGQSDRPGGHRSHIKRWIGAEEMRLLFNNPVMREGLNITVRRGNKWLGYSGLVSVAESDEALVKFSVDVIHTMAVERFNDLNGNDQLLSLEHDPDCHTYTGLLEAMQEAYEGFHSLMPVTVVFFRAPKLKG